MESIVDVSDLCFYIFIYYHTGELEYSDSLPMNARFLGIIFQYLIFYATKKLIRLNIAITQIAGLTFVLPVQILIAA